ncbi:hypothetical protein LVJ94_04245 [Pendulispora rubella]|uniref:Uncharacterized protein n=1 Tax=Pendulispora rubella TaxID=2741070 RepID=A0ABZ2L6E8_9BACT
MDLNSFRIPFITSAFLVSALVAKPAGAQTVPAPESPGGAEAKPPTPPAQTPAAEPPLEPPPPLPPMGATAPTAAPPPAGPGPVPEGPPKAAAAPSAPAFPQTLVGHYLKDPASTMFNGFRVTLLNFIELDVMHDSTQSFPQGDGFGGSPALARSTLTDGTPNYAGQHGRLVISPRNTQLGLQVEAPEFAKIKGTGHCRMDFMGHEPSNPQSPPSNLSEAGFYNSPTARVFHCYAKAETPYVDVLGGMTYTLFGQAPHFFPASIIYLGLPGMVFARAAQVRLSHQFHTDPIDVYVGAGVFRPPQRDSGEPDLEGALRVMFNGWRGAHTLGALGTKIDPLSLGVSGVYRNYKVQERTAVPVNLNKATGAGVSFDALIPIIPAKNNRDVGNSLTANASFVTGTGIADQWLGVTGGVPAQTRPPATPSGPPGPMLNIDPGLALYDPNGDLKTVNWQSYQVGLQYYLPGPLDIWIMGNYTHLSSSNLSRIAPWDGKSVSTVFDKQDYFDVDLFWALTPNLQIAFGYANTRQTFLDGGKETNDRFMGATYYIF